MLAVRVVTAMHFIYLRLKLFPWTSQPQTATCSLQSWPVRPERGISSTSAIWCESEWCLEACCSGGHLLVILGGSLATKVHTGNWWGDNGRNPSCLWALVCTSICMHVMKYHITQCDEEFCMIFLNFLSTHYYFWKRVKKSMSLRICLSIHRWNEAYKRR